MHCGHKSAAAQADGPARQGALTWGLKAELLHKLLLPGVAFECNTRQGKLRLAMKWRLTIFSCAGGEVGRVDNREIDRAAGITIVDVDWMVPCADM